MMPERLAQIRVNFKFLTRQHYLWRDGDNPIHRKKITLMISSAVTNAMTGA